MISFNYNKRAFSFLFSLNTLILTSYYLSSTRFTLHVEAFALTHHHHHPSTTKHRHESSSSTTCLHFEPGLIAAAAGIAGSAIGWAGRTPEVSTFESQATQAQKELNELRRRFNVSQTEYDSKSDNYERALYEMDSEFEEQTTVLKAEYEKKIEETTVRLDGEYKVKLAKAKDVMKKENDLKLIEQEGKLRQGFLQEKMEYEKEFNRKNARQMVETLERQSHLVSENQELKSSLDKVQKDLKEIMEMKKLF